MKHSSSRGKGVHSTPAHHNHQASSTQTAQSASATAPAPEQNDRVLNWVNEAQAPAGAPVRSAGQSGQGRGNKKKRLAANFPAPN